MSTPQEYLDAELKRFIEEAARHGLTEEQYHDLCLQKTNEMRRSLRLDALK